MEEFVRRGDDGVVDGEDCDFLVSMHMVDGNRRNEGGRDGVRWDEGCWAHLGIL